MEIKCPACDYENEEGTKFCSNCNEPLVAPKFSINKEKIKRIIKKERLGMNKNQKIILAIFIPIIIFFIALMIANIIGTEVTTRYTDWKYDQFSKSIISTGPYKTYAHDPFDLEKTWYVWMFYLIFCCIFEYKLFEDKKKKDNK